MVVGGGVPMADVAVPAPPEGLLPGQLGVVLLGRVIMGDIAVTLVDLAMREFAEVSESPADGWLVSSLPRPALHGYQGKLLQGLPGSPSPVSRLSPSVLDKVRSALVDEAVHRGWLRRLHHDQRTKRGEELGRQVRSFQRDLRHLKTARGEDALAVSLLPYALHFGLVSRSAIPLARFAQAWVETFAYLPGWRRRQQPRTFGEVPMSKKSAAQELPDLIAMSWAANAGFP
jgi:hypothetical protein